MRLWSCDYVIGRTQVRRGPPDSSPQQSGTSRTVKRYPSSSEPITSNSLPSSNGYANGHGSERTNWYGHRNRQSSSFNNPRPASDSQLHRQFNNALLPAGKNHKLTTSKAYEAIGQYPYFSIFSYSSFKTPSHSDSLHSIYPSCIPLSTHPPLCIASRCFISWLL